MPPGPVRAVVLLAHGGKSRSTAPAAPWRTPALRMYPFLVDLARAGRSGGLLAVQLRYRMRGYNSGDPVDDVRWALDRLAVHAAPVCLLGHSMGGRACLRAAGHPGVVAVAGLAPWLPPDEPVDQLTGRSVLLVHGRADRVTDPAGSRAFAMRARSVAARLTEVEIAGTGHAMLRRPQLWHALARSFCLAAVGLGEEDPRLAGPVDADSIVQL
jgi:dienelactone hydrolase